MYNKNKTEYVQMSDSIWPHPYCSLWLTDWYSQNKHQNKYLFNRGVLYMIKKTIFYKICLLTWVLVVDTCLKDPGVRVLLLVNSHLCHEGGMRVEPPSSLVLHQLQFVTVLNLVCFAPFEYWPREKIIKIIDLWCLDPEETKCRWLDTVGLTPPGSDSHIIVTWHDSKL